MMNKVPAVYEHSYSYEYAETACSQFSRCYEYEYEYEFSTVPVQYRYRSGIKRIWQAGTPGRRAGLPDEKACYSR